MANRLLDRQARLLEYLSSAEAIFGDTNATVNQALREIDRDALHLQARFACNKRIDKIMRVLPRTFDLLGADRRLILREFVELSRPTNKSSLVNAGEFHEFLRKQIADQLLAAADGVERAGISPVVKHFERVNNYSRHLKNSKVRKTCGQNNDERRVAFGRGNLSAICIQDRSNVIGAKERNDGPVPAHASFRS